MVLVWVAGPAWDVALRLPQAPRWGRPGELKPSLDPPPRARAGVSPVAAMQWALRGREPRVLRSWGGEERAY